MRFGKLLVQREVERKNGYRHWLCFCDCGKTTTVVGSSLLNEDTKSCGCYRSSRMTEQNTKSNPMNGIRRTASDKYRAAIGVNNSYKELGTFFNN